MSSMSSHTITMPSSTSSSTTSSTPFAIPAIEPSAKVHYSRNQIYQVFHRLHADPISRLVQRMYTHTRLVTLQENMPDCRAWIIHICLYVHIGASFQMSTLLYIHVQGKFYISTIQQVQYSVIKPVFYSRNLVSASSVLLSRSTVTPKDS
ncbi:hypothetical protein K435DRAFT_395299 [Dendrothele bispora CBS 962.96]|uniref:Uncharacterized protein n=1 Tax=Dendrothele bispora (strain CBS 962.96) TaxID=1314807 RepID=A0A4S8L947_DENBC|nr:hypothetical protein K435DRAFT_395299 [Dendrothele bispora CBS 962.96]